MKGEQMKSEEIQIRHTFSVQELADMGRDQAGKLDKLTSLKLEFDSVKKQYNSQIAEHEAGISHISTRVHAGWEMRNVRCLLVDERPEGYRLSIRLDTGHIAIRRKLDNSERQLELSTEAPRQYTVIATLHVDDPSWDADVVDVPLFDEEHDALKNLDVVGFRDFVPRRSLPEPKKDPKKK